MRADLDRPKDLGAGPDVDMPGDFGNPAAAAATKRDLELNQIAAGSAGWKRPLLNARNISLSAVDRRRPRDFPGASAIHPVEISISFGTRY